MICFHGGSLSEQSKSTTMYSSESQKQLDILYTCILYNLLSLISVSDGNNQNLVMGQETGCRIKSERRIQGWGRERREKEREKGQA